MSYSDFTMNKDKFLYTSQINWESNAMELFKSWAPELTSLLDQTFNYAFKSAQFSDPRLSDSTAAINEILSLYLLRVYGVDQSEDFDYKIVNTIFPIAFKVYIKNVACYP